MQAALDLGIRDIEVYGDSILIICQAVGDWKTREPKLIPYREYLEELIIRFRKITFSYMPRTKNQFADALATLASMIRISEGTDIPLRWKHELSLPIARLWKRNLTASLGIMTSKHSSKKGNTRGN